MKRQPIRWPFLLLMIFGVSVPLMAAAVLQKKTLKSWDTYVQLTEKRITSELQGNAGFLRVELVKPAVASKMRAQLRAGNVYVEQLRTVDAAGHEVHGDDGLIHHWYGAIFIPGVKVASLLRWVQDYDHQNRYFKEVERSKLLSRNGDTFQIYLRLVRKKLVTVHYNTEHTVVYQNNGPGRASSKSYSTKIAQIEDAGTPSEKEETIGDDSGYVWRLNSYWRFREEDGGVIVECESISLSRGLPFGVGWALGSYVESIPQESLESTLTSIRDGVRQGI